MAASTPRLIEARGGLVVIAKREGPPRVLIVDDDEDAATLLADALVRAGFAATTAGTGERAVALVASVEPDVVLLDLGLPDVDGVELAARLRARSPSTMHVVALTGRGGAADRQRTADAGFVAHIVKPLDLATLIPFLAATCGRSTMVSSASATRPRS